MKKFLSILIILSMMFSVLPSFQVEVHAASIKYRQTSKANVPLRNDYGSEHDTVSKISSKGTTFKIIDTAKKRTGLFSYNTWYKVEIGEGLTDNGKYGIFWLWDGNTTEHTHSYSNMACTKKGCTHAEGIKKEEYLGKNVTRYIQIDSVSVKVAPYKEAARVHIPLKKGASITVTHKVTNSRNNIWYRLSNGYYIYSSNLGVLSPKQEIKTYVDYTNTPVINRNDYFTPDEPPITFICGGVKHIYSTSTGKCIYCGLQQPITKEPVKNLTFKAKNNTVGRELPYKDATKKKEYASGDIVDVSYKFKDSYDTIWYQTPEGYWVTGLEDVSLKGFCLNVSTYKFCDLSESFIPQKFYEPTNAEISNVVWHPSTPGVVEINHETGEIKPITKGNTDVICTVTSAEGKTMSATIKVIVDEMAILDKWEYTNNSFDYNLAKKCSEYASLVNTNYYYTAYCIGETNDEELLVYKGKDTKIPLRLYERLRDDGYYYESVNFENPTVTNSPAVFATKKYRVENEPLNVIFVSMPGTTGKDSWLGNVQITGEGYNSEIFKDGYHYSFKAAADKVKSQLDSFVARNRIEKPLVVVTGHSRGAAVGNLLSEQIYNDKHTYRDVTAYLFATPNTTRNPKVMNGIYNICNESDFVTYIPLSSENSAKGIDWGYGKNGEIRSFDSFYQQITNAYNFNYYANRMFSISSYGCNPEYSWFSDTPSGIKAYMSGVWKKPSFYYNTPICEGKTAYNYFKSGLVPAIYGDVNELGKHSNGLDNVVLSIFAGVEKHPEECDFNVLTGFFVTNGFDKLRALSTFHHSHEMMTYHAAILSKCHNSGQNPSIFSIGLLSVEENTTLNQGEHDALYSFFTQNENQLMLETNGWDINDTSTWYGIEWNENGNVTKIDLSYLNLSGWFNANNFPELQDLNLDGNDISMLTVSSCENLVSLSCMSNSLSAISVNNCANLQNLDCSFNQIGNLNLSNMSQLVELNCYGNSINNLNLNGATALQTVRCGNNELTTVDISTNTSLNTFYCGDNRIVESQNSDLVESINAINLNGGSAIIGTQKYNENFEFNEAELTSLTQFANMSLNLEKLGWDLENPYTWQGVEWQIKAIEEVLDDGTKEVREEYHITSLNFDGLDLEGDLCIPEAEFVESVSCADSSLTTLNLSGCSGLSSINCNNAGISELTIDGCSSLQSINCDDNYLEVERVESSLNQIGLNTGIATYENQNIDAIDECFNETERMVLIDLLLSGDNAEKLNWDLDWPGTWDGIVWTNVDGEYRVNKIDLAETEVYGILDLTAFEYLEDFNFSGTQIESVTLPDCITQIPEAAFYNSGIETIYMQNGITNIGKSAFAYCEKLNSVVLPKTIAKVFDNAFMGSKNLKYVVFTGDEPLQVGFDIFYDVSPEFNLVYFASATWNEDAEILSNCNNIVSKDDYIILLDKPIELKPDDYYHETNTYAGDEVTFTVATKTTGTTATSMLAVYKENGALDSLVSTPITLDNYLNVVTFEDVNIQYVGEEYCKIKAFLWDDANTIKPIADAVEKLLIKPTAE